ncbi:MAG: hypothetical protein AB1768_20810 [Pseudomonadota bacterium]
MTVYTYPPSGAYLTLFIKACNAVGCSDPGPSTQFFITCEETTPGQPPATPGNLRFSSCTKTAPNTATCTIAWNAVTGATNYRLEKWTGTSWELWYSGPGTSYTRSGLYCGTSSTSGPVTVRVRAENSAGASGWNQQTLYTTACPDTLQPPATPGNLRFSSCTKTAPNTATCTIAWNAVTGATNYRLEKWTGTSWELWYSGPGTSYTRSGLYCGTSSTSGPVTVRVRAENSAGASGWNQQTLYTTPCP